MRNIISKLILGSLTVTFVSCIANYDNVNSNPYEPGDLSADDYALQSAMNNLAGCVISPDVNTAQFTDCLLGGPMGGYYATANAGFTETITNFNPKDDWSNVFLKSEELIPVLYSNLSVVEIVSRNTNNPVPYAIAKIIKVAAMHRVTDTYGPIPYSQMGGQNTLVAYDSQETVYDTFFDELNSAITDLNEHSNALLTPTADYIYNGNVKNWIKFANSLKLRLAIRIAYANPAKAKEMAEGAVNAENGGVIESNVDNAAWNYFASTQNPVYVATRYNQLQAADHPDSKPCLTGGDTRAAADIICYMNGYADNRREKYFVKSEWGTGYDYVGMRRGIVIPTLATTGHKYSGVNILPTSPLYWINAAEVAFLRAEGAAIFDFNMGGSAEAFYNDGIRLSFEQWAAEGADEYMNNEVRKPGSYTDPAGDNTYENALSTVTVKWNEGAGKEEKQERIIVQKWIANWQLGNEAWADYRRTGYPKLIPVKNNKSGGVVDSEKGARRMPYPLDEFASNLENVQYAVTNYLKGPDNMATDVWWAIRK